MNRTLEAKTQVIAKLRSFALANYVDGGHWVVETFEDADFAKFIEGATVRQAKSRLRQYWRDLQDMQEACKGF